MRIQIYQVFHLILLLYAETMFSLFKLQRLGGVPRLKNPYTSLEPGLQ